MPTKQFALEREGPKRLEISWKGAFKEVDVRVDGKSIGTVPNKAALKMGQVLQLPDGSTLSLKLSQGFLSFSTGLELLHDGVPVPGSQTDAHTLVRTAGQIVYFIAAVNALLGFAVLLFDVKALEAIAGEGGVGALLIAGVYSVLAFFTMGGSFWALLAAAAIYVIDWASGVAMSFSGGHPNVGGMIVRILFLNVMVQGLRAAWTLKKERAAVSAPR